MNNIIFKMKFSWINAVGLLMAFVVFMKCEEMGTVTAASSCNFYNGNWVVDSSYPLYNSTSCPFIHKEFNCQGNGRTDKGYLSYRWQPRGCNLLRFNGRNFLEKYKGKSFMFVGDSLSRNQWQSLLCMIYTSMPHVKYTTGTEGRSVTFITFTDYGVKVMLNTNVLLVDVVVEKMGRVLKLDSVKFSSKVWQGIDFLIFNTWNWWARRPPGQTWDYVEYENKVSKDMNRFEAFEIGLKTWAKWVDETVDPARTKVFFEGVSPPQYSGSGWGEPSATTCKGQTKPLLVSTYPGKLPPALAVQKSVLRSMKKHVTLLDITNLSLLRKDGHPSIYGLKGLTGMDCTHWCIAGVPDTWNTIFYNLII